MPSSLKMAVKYQLGLALHLNSIAALISLVWVALASEVTAAYGDNLTTELGRLYGGAKKKTTRSVCGCKSYSKQSLNVTLL
jgi:hypothetical protein